jgi:hypothetical protein
MPSMLLVSLVARGQWRHWQALVRPMAPLAGKDPMRVRLQGT